MIKKLKVLFTFFAVVLFTSNASAQMTICTDPPDPPCPDCMKIDIVNNLPCDLNFYWGYDGCTGIVGAKTIYANNNGCNPQNCCSLPPCTLYGPCAKCPGDDSQCECPNRLFISISATQQFWPWGDFPTMIANGSTTFLVSGASNTLCPGCSAVEIIIQVDPLNLDPNYAIITFNCIT